MKQRQGDTWKHWFNSSLQSQHIPFKFLTPIMSGVVAVHTQASKLGRIGFDSRSMTKGHVTADLQDGNGFLSR